MSSVLPFEKSQSGSINQSKETQSASLIRNLGITFFENVMTKGLSFLVILLLTRMLGPEDYGRYSFIFVTVALSSALFDFGMENTAVRFAARDKSKRDTIFGLYLLVKFFIVLGLIMFFWLSGDWFFSQMGKGDASRFLPYLIIGLIGESLFFVNDTYLQANQQFQFRAILNIARAAMTVVYIWILAAGNWMMLDYVFYLYLIPVAFSFLFLPKYFTFMRSFFQQRIGVTLFEEISRYEKWMFVYSIANNLLGRVDFFMLSFWAGFHQLGLYNAAVQLCAVVSFLPLVLGKVLLPTLSELDEEAIFQTTRRVIRATTLVCVAALLFVPLTGWVAPLLLGKEYVDSVPVLQILLLAFIGGLMSMPYEQALYSLGKPKVLSVCRYVQLALIVVLNLMAIPLLGIYGAAMTAVVGRVLSLVAVRYFYRDLEERSISRQQPPVYATAGAGAA